MKKIYLLISMLLICNISKAQNLVPNPGFENMLQCPTNNIANWIHLTDSWYSARGSAQYFHPCPTDSLSLWDVPVNGFGYQQAANGDAFGGITCYGDTTGLNGNYREYMGVQLSSPLVVGQQYYVSFKVARAADGFYYYTDWAVNKLGALFTTQYYSTGTSDPIPNFAHVYTDSVITDSAQWTLIKGSFIADSAYQYLLLGNFFDQQHTTSVKLGLVNSLGAFYYVDDVCVTTDPLPCFPTAGISEVEKSNQVNLFPNPFTDKINIVTKENNLLEFVLYDVMGRKNIYQSFSNSTLINTAQLAKGIYIYELKDNKGIVRTGKIVKE